MKVTIEMNEKQAYILKNALDLYSRLLMGQLRELDSFFTSETDCWKNPDRDMIVKYAEQIKDIVYPEIKGYDSWGIFNEKCPENSKIAYDMIQILRHELIKVRDPEKKCGYIVDWNSPMAASEEEFIKVNIKT